jgi:hypothetical protein
MDYEEKLVVIGAFHAVIDPRGDGMFGMLLIHSQSQQTQHGSGKIYRDC